MRDVDEHTRVPPPSLGPGRGYRIEHELTVRALPEELYRMWRDLSLMGRIFQHVERVECTTPLRSHWVVPGPLGSTVEWDAEIIDDVENEHIGWQSLPGSEVDCAGSVHFHPCGANSTTLRVVLRYDPPGGAVGAAVATLFGVNPSTTIPDDLDCFKYQVETGGVPSKDPVQTASEDSFPASDPPSWTAGPSTTDAPQVTSEPKPPYSRQKLEKPGLEADMEQRPRWRAPRYRAAGKLEGKVALVTGGDSGIGRAVSYLYAREGADVAIVHLPEEERDADETRRAIEEAGHRCLDLPGDVTDRAFCHEAVERTVAELGRLDILVSNAAWQNRKHRMEEITREEWERTFRTNVDAYFHLVQAALPHLREGAAIIATSSQAGLLGSESLPDYAATKGAIDAFTKSLARQLASRGIRVNAVAPGPVWTPLNPADTGASPEHIEQFGKKQPMQRAAQPEEVAPAYVFLASDADASYVTGIVLEEMGGLTTG